MLLNEESIVTDPTEIPLLVVSNFLLPSKNKSTESLPLASIMLSLSAKLFTINTSVKVLAEA